MRLELELQPEGQYLVEFCIHLKTYDAKKSGISLGLM